jgi:plasmid stabilization system protein ParE
MAYQVSTSPRAERDFANLYKAIHAEESDAALNWYRTLKEAVLSLAELPYRCPVTPEKDQLRHLLYGRRPDVYRVIYRIMERQKRVEVLHIRHGARRRFTASDLK